MILTAFFNFFFFFFSFSIKLFYILKIYFFFSLLTCIVSGKRANLYVWYDNEFGYSCQVVRLLQNLCKITHPRCPPALMEAVQSEAEEEEEDE